MKKKIIKKVFALLEEWLKINYSISDFELELPIKLIQIDYNFTTKFYFYLLEKENIPEYVLLSKNYIIDFFIEQTRDYSADPGCLIFLLIYSPNKEFSNYLLNKMKYMIMDEKDFYRKEENEKFIIFKLFFE